MVNDVSESRLVIYFIEGLAEPLKWMVKAHHPSTSQDSMDKTQYLQDDIPKTIFPPKSNFPAKFKDERPFQKGPSGNLMRDNFSKDRDELRRKKLCFSCQQPWVPGHKCAKGKAHYIEVFFLSEYEEEDVDQPVYEKENFETSQEEEKPQ